MKKAIVIVLFLLAVAWYFFPVGIEVFSSPQTGRSLLFAMRLALPATLLALGGIGLLPWLMTAGFFFCAVGDAMGVLGSFEGQMGGFAVAHICFIIWLGKKVYESTSQRVNRSTSQRVNESKSLLLLILVLIPLVVAGVRIIPQIQDKVIRVGCIIYSLLLTGTLWTAWLRVASSRINPLKQKCRKLWPLLTALGATSFFVSDFVLAWNKFVGPVTNSRIVIMTTYYAALLLLFMGEAYKNKKNSHF